MKRQMRSACILMVSVAYLTGQDKARMAAEMVGEGPYVQEKIQGAALVYAVGIVYNEK